MPSWYDIQGLPDRFEEDCVGIEESRARITALIEAEIAARIPASRIVVAGFSQGGMMALHCGLRLQPAPAAIISSSGALLRHEDLSAMPDTPYPPVQLVHGSDNQVLPCALMHEAVQILQPLGVVVDSVERPGLGHGIDPDGLTASITFLSSHITD